MAATTNFAVILRCEPSSARLEGWPQAGLSSFEARKCAHLRMTVFVRCLQGN